MKDNWHVPATHKPPFVQGRARHGDGIAGATVDFDFDAMEGRPDGGQDNGQRERMAQQEASIRILQFVCGNNATAKEAGRHAILLLQILRPEKSQQEVAIQLGITEGRVSQLLNKLRSKIVNVFNGID